MAALPLFFADGNIYGYVRLMCSIMYFGAYSSKSDEFQLLVSMQMDIDLLPSCKINAAVPNPQDHILPLPYPIKALGLILHGRRIRAPCLD